MAVLVLTTLALFFLFSISYIYGTPGLYLPLGGVMLLVVVITIWVHYSGANSWRDAELYANGILVPVSRWDGWERFIPREEVVEVEMSTGQFGREPPPRSKGEWAMLIIITRDDDMHGTGWKGIGDVVRAMELIRSEWGIEVKRTD